MLLTIALPLSLGIIMLSLGMGLTPADFARVARMPVAVAAGLACQIVALPLVALLLVQILPLSPELAVGVMILACAPGGVTSNVLVRIAAGNVALSVTLTAIASLISVISVPLIVALSLDIFLGEAAPPIDITRLALTMFALTAVPVALGMGVRLLAPSVTAHVEPVLSTIAVTLFALLVVAALVTNWTLFTSNIPTLGPILLALIAVMVSIGFLLGRALRLGRPDSIAIAMEAGIQNGSLGITVGALVTVGDTVGAFSLASGVYGILMYLTCIPLALWLRRGDRRGV